MAKTNASWWSAKRKKDVARRMILSGHTNQQINSHIKKQCGTGISRADIANVREELGKSGPNRKNFVFHTPPRKVKEQLKENGVPTEIQADPLSNGLNRAAQRFISAMKKHGVKEAIISANGTVKVTQVQVTTFEVTDG
jgi:hypothetical protein